MMDRRFFLFGLLGCAGLASGAAAAGTLHPSDDSRSVPERTAGALDAAEIAFSQQRPQLHYNRQRQHGQPPRHRRRRRRPPHWRHR